MKTGRHESTHRVAVIDDHDMMREGLTLGLDRHDGIDIIGSCGTVTDFAQLVAVWNPSVVVADYQLPDGTGIDIINLVHSLHLDAKVIVLTGLERTGLLHDVITAGGDGLLSKSVTIADLAEAVIAVGNGASAFPPSALREWAERDLTDTGATLTPREREVLTLLAQAKSVGTIAEELHVSSNTVRNHIRAILNKLHVSSQLEAVVTAQRAGLV